MMPFITGDSASKFDRIYNNLAKMCYAVDVYCADVYSPVSGTVVSVYSEGNFKTVVIKVNSDEVIKLSNLNSADVMCTSSVRIGDKVGSCSHYVRMEYGNTWSVTPVQPIRCDGKTFFRNDPSPIASGDYLPTAKKNTVWGQSDCLLYTNLNKEQLEEFSDNRGDNIVEF